MNPLLFEFDDIPPGLNSSDGQQRMHWAKYREKKQFWEWLVKSEAIDRRPEKPIEKCAIVYRVKAVRTWDYDNLCSTFKFIGDGLVAAEILKDDSVLVIQAFFPIYERVHKFDKEGCSVEIIPIAILD